MSVPSLALAVHGRFTAHPWVDPAGEQDCFSAFLALSTTLGWNSAVDGTDPGLWGMNDAGGPFFSSDEPALCGWFQVDPEGDGKPLPIEAMTDAAVRTLERFGVLEVAGLEYYVPLGLAGSAARRLQDGQSWFALASSAGRDRVRVTLDSGDCAAVVERCDAILELLRVVAPSEEGMNPVRLHDVAPVDVTPNVPWRWWLGSGTSNVVTLAATVTDGSMLGLAHVVTCLVEACRAAGHHRSGRCPSRARLTVACRRATRISSSSALSDTATHKSSEASTATRASYRNRVRHRAA